MALLWIDGFEQYADVADVVDAYPSSQSLGITIQTGRNTGAGNNKSIELDFNLTNISPRITESTATVVMGFAYNQLTAGAVNTDLARLYNGATEMITLRITTAGEIAIDRGATQLDITSGFGFSPAGWYYIEFKVFIHDSTGTYEVWVDGVSELSGTSQDTKNGTPNTIDRLWLGGSSVDANFDDWYFLDDSGADNTDRLGDCRVETVFPDADGTTNNFTAVGTGTTNADRVDDGSTPDDDSTYVHSSTATDKDLYGFAALAGTIDTVFAVQIALRARKEETGERLIRTVARSSTTEVESGDLSLGPDWRYKHGMYENDPNGAIDWTESSVNAAEFGIKIQS